MQITYKYLLAILLIYFELNKFIESIQISTDCKKGEYYDIDLFECSICPENMIPRSDGI